MKGQGLKITRSLNETISIGTLWEVTNRGIRGDVVLIEVFEALRVRDTLPYRIGDRVLISPNIDVIVHNIRPAVGKVDFRFDAPRSVEIHKKERIPSSTRRAG